MEHHRLRLKITKTKGTKTTRQLNNTTTLGHHRLRLQNAKTQKHHRIPKTKERKSNSPRVAVAVVVLAAVAAVAVGDYFTLK